MSNHFLDLPCGNIVVMACHDLNMEHPRGIAASKKGGQRDIIRTEFELLLGQKHPILAIHHAHTTDKADTWSRSWNHLLTLCPSLKHYATIGVYYREQGERSTIQEVLDHTQRGGSIDFLFFDGSLKKTAPPLKTIDNSRLEKTPKDVKIWNEDSFFTTIQASLTPEEVNCATRIFNWAQQKKLTLYWSPSGTFYPMFSDSRSNRNNLIALKLNGTIQVQLKYIQNKPPFDNEETRKVFLNKLNAIPGIQISENYLSGLPHIHLKALNSEVKVEEFLNVLEWFLSKIKK